MRRTGDLVSKPANTSVNQMQTFFLRAKTNWRETCVTPFGFLGCWGLAPGSRDEFGTYAEAELKTDEYTGVQARGV